MFTGIVKTTLEASGWSEGRKVSTIQWVVPLESEGFAMLPDAVKVLGNLGGLRVVPPKATTNAYSPEVLTFDPVLGASGDFDRVDYWQKRLGKTLSPIGETGGGAILLLAEDSCVYSCWDRILWMDGDSLEDALDNTLISARRAPVEVGTMNG
jgi:hypothetical protein